MRNIEERPAAVRAAYASWLAAVGAGVFETCLVIAREGVAGNTAGLVFRTTVFVIAVAVAWRMYHGRRWARWALALGLGLVGTSSLVADPIAWLAGGESVSDLIAASGPADLAFGASRVLHIAAVVTGVILMFTPSANTWFRSSGRRGGDPAARPGRTVPRATVAA